jgi:hypothetical protein
VGHKFTLVLSREISAEETVALEEAGCAGAIFGSDALPTNAEIPVTKMDFDVSSSPSLAEAIESALEAVKKVPDLTVPGLTVPAQPARAEDQGQAPDGVVEGVVVESAVIEEKPATEETAVRKPTAKKSAVKRPARKKAAAPDNEEAAAGTS